MKDGDLVPVDETDFFESLVDGAIANRTTDTEEVVFDAPPDDPTHRVATILERKYRPLNLNHDPVRSAILGALGSTDMNYLLGDVSMVSPKDLATLVCITDASRHLNLRPVFQGSAADYIMNIARQFGQHVGSMLQLALTDDLAVPPVQKGHKPLLHDPFTAYHPRTLIASAFVADAVAPYDERLSHASDPSDISGLVTLEEATRRVSRENAQLIRDLANNPTVPIDDAVRRTFVLLAQEQGLLSGLSPDEILDKYSRAMRSRRAFAAHIASEAEYLKGVHFDHQSMAEHIRTQFMERSGIIIDKQKFRNEDEYAQFREYLLAGSIPMFRAEDTLPFQPDERYNLLKKELDGRTTELERVQAADETEMWKHMETKAFMAAVAEHIAKQLKTPIDYWPHLKGDPRQFGRAMKPQVLKILKAQHGVPGIEFLIGDKLKVVKLAGYDPSANEATYYHGGDEADLPLNEEVEFAGALDEDNILVKYETRRGMKQFNLHPSEIEPLIKREKPKTQTLEELASEIIKTAEDATLPVFMKKTRTAAEARLKVIIRDYQAALEEHEAALRNNRFHYGERVRVARALGEREGFYRGNRAKVENYPIGILGEVLEVVEGGYVNVHFRDTGKTVRFHPDELQVLRAFALPDNKYPTGAKVIIRDRPEGDYAVSRPGSWGYIKGKMGRDHLRVEFQHVTGERRRTPVTFDDIRKVDVIVENPMGELAPDLKNIMQNLQSIVDEAERDMKAHKSKRENLIQQSVDTFRAMGIDDNVITMYLALHFGDDITKHDRVPKITLFSQLRDLQGRADYTKLIPDLEKKVAEKLGIILPKAEDKRIDGLGDYLTTLVDRIMHSVRPAKGKLTYRRGDKVISTDNDRGIPVGTVGTYKEVCTYDGVTDGCHVDFGELGDDHCTRKVFITKGAPAYDVPDTKYDAFTKGAKVRLKREYREDWEPDGVGTIIEYNEAEQYATIRWPGVGEDSYDTDNLELMNPEDVLKGKKLEEYRKKKERIESLRAEIRGEIDPLVRESQAAHEQVYAQIDGLCRMAIESLTSLGVQKDAVEDLFRKNMRDISYLKTRNLL